MKIVTHLEDTEIQKLIEDTFEANYLHLLNWLNKIVRNREDAEDLCQEAFLKLFSIVCSKNLRGIRIVDIDQYLWKIARNLLNRYKKKYDKDSQINIDLDRKINIEEINEEDRHNDNDNLKSKLRKAISQLNYKHREATIMYHIEKKSLKDISEKLQVTEKYVKKILYESFDTIRTNYQMDNYETEYNYRPNYLKMAFSGEKNKTSDLKIISENLTKQNICIACYKSPCNIDDLGKILGIPKSYLEYDLKWLHERVFLKKTQNRYSTMFFIFDNIFNSMLINTFIKHKSCLDKIINKLIERKESIKSINFIGSDKSMEKLLWFLIYSFTDLTSSLIIFNKHDFNYDNLQRIKGRKNYTIGIYDTGKTIPLNPLFVDKYNDMCDWTVNGTHNYKNSQYELNWINLFNENMLQNKKDEILPYTQIILKSKEVICKSINNNFNFMYLSAKEKIILNQLISLDFLSLANDGKTIIPNIYVFTQKQRNDLINIYLEIFIEMKPYLNKLYSDIDKICKSTIPSQLHADLKYYSYFAMMFSHLFTIGFAYYDGKIYKPQNAYDALCLTVNITKKDKTYENEKYIVKLITDNY